MSSEQNGKEKKLFQLKKLLSAFGYTKTQVLHILAAAPKLIEEDLDELYHKYLFLSVLDEDRKTRFFNNPKELKRPLSIMYARYKYCQEVKYPYISWNKIVSESDTAFAMTFVQKAYAFNETYQTILEPVKLNGEALEKMFPLNENYNCFMAKLESKEANQIICEQYQLLYEIRALKIARYIIQFKTSTRKTAEIFQCSNAMIVAYIDSLKETNPKEYKEAREVLENNRACNNSIKNSEIKQRVLMGTCLYLSGIVDSIEELAKYQGIDYFQAYRDLTKRLKKLDEEKYNLVKAKMREHSRENLRKRAIK